MNQYCVVVANGSRARFFKLEEAEIPEIQSGPNLVETLDLVNPEKESAGGNPWSENKSGRNRSANGNAHGYDDHRKQHEEEFERRFANSIAEEASRMSKKLHASRLILVSQERMLGHLRTAISPMLNGIKSWELAKDLSKLNPIDLHEHLAKEKILPERRGPGVS